MKYNVFAYAPNGDHIGNFNTDDHEGDQFADAMRQFEEDRKIIDTQFDVFDAVTSQWVSTFASFRAN